MFNKISKHFNICKVSAKVGFESLQGTHKFIKMLNTNAIKEGLIKSKSHLILVQLSHFAIPASILHKHTNFVLFDLNFSTE